MTTAYEDLVAVAEGDFATAKKAYTAKLSEIATKYNAKQPIVAADWNALISGAYDPLTDASNSLRRFIATLPIGILIDAFLARTADPAKRVDDINAFIAMYYCIYDRLASLPDVPTAQRIIGKLSADLTDAITRGLAAGPGTVIDNFPYSACDDYKQVILAAPIEP